MSKIDIETFETSSGWSAGSGSTMSAYGLNEHADFIADEKTKSLIISIPSGNTGKYIEKTLTPVDVTDYDELVFYVWSRNVLNDSMYEASYTVDLGDGVEYIIPLTQDYLQPVVIDISAMTSISKIKIKSYQDDEDYLVFSAMEATTEELPLDVFIGVQSKLESLIYADQGDGVLLGTVNCVAGESELQFTGSINFLERYSKIKIKKSSTSETHQISEKNGNRVKFTSLDDGTKIVNTLSGASVYLQFPVEYGNLQEQYLPGISIWGLTPELVQRGNDIESVFDNHKYSGSSSQRREGRIFKYFISLDCSAHHYELIGILSEICRKFIARQVLWVNNRKFEIKYEQTPTESEPTQSFEFIPRIQYIFSIEYKEELYARATNPLTTTCTKTITIT